MDTNVSLNWNIEKELPKTIKVIGVGGGGVNSVDYMYKAGIHGVNFAACNTDKQSFDDVEVPVKITLGSGLGSGGNPEKAKEEFEKSIAEVDKILSDGTKMVFIASGMGGGTGSGAAPLLAKMARDKGILTVGIVTIPFLFEMIPRIIQALDAVEEMSKNVDALIVINNERLKDFYPKAALEKAFEKPNEVLAMSVKSVAEIITVRGTINRDFEDVTSTMKDSGVALVSYGFGKGDQRIENAIREALDSPLLNNNDIYNAKRILIYLSYRINADLEMEEVQQTITNFMERFDKHIKMIWGCGMDDSLTEDQDVKFTIIATGFGIDAIPEIEDWKDEETRRRIQEDEEQKRKDIERVEGIYKVNINTNQKVKRATKENIVILTTDELDNDEFINFLEKYPTFNRKPEEIAKIRKPAKNTAKAEDDINKQENTISKASNIIEF